MKNHKISHCRNNSKPNRKIVELGKSLIFIYMITYFPFWVHALQSKWMF